MQNNALTDEANHFKFSHLFWIKITAILRFKLSMQILNDFIVYKNIRYIHIQVYFPAICPALLRGPPFSLEKCQQFFL